MRTGEGLRAKTVSVTLSSLASAGLLGVAAIVIARSLGPEGRGVFAASYSLVFVLMLAGSLGVGPGGRRLLAIGPSEVGVSHSEYASASRWLIAAQAPLATFAAIALLPVFGGARSVAEQVAFVVCCVTSLASLLAREALFGLGDGSVSALILACGCAVTLGGVIGVVAMGEPSVSSFLWMYAVAGAGEFAAGELRARRRTRHADEAIRPRSRARVFASGRPVVVLLLAQAAATRGDRLVIGAISGSVDLGQYAVAVSVMELLSMGSFALGNVAFQAVASGSMPAETMRRARYVTLVGTALAAGLLMLAAPWLIRLAFGAQFEEAIPALRVLALAAIPYGSFQIDTQQLIASARSRSAAVLVVGAAVAMIGGDLIVVPRWGIQGAAWVSVAVYAVFAVSASSVVKRDR